MIMLPLMLLSVHTVIIMLYYAYDHITVADVVAVGPSRAVQIALGVRARSLLLARRLRFPRSHSPDQFFVVLWF
jgi:hypothetical protein